MSQPEPNLVSTLLPKALSRRDWHLLFSVIHDEVIIDVDSIREKGEPLCAASLKDLLDHDAALQKTYRELMNTPTARCCECGVEKVHGKSASAKMHSDYCPKSRA